MALVTTVTEKQRLLRKLFHSVVKSPTKGCRGGSLKYIVSFFSGNLTSLQSKGACATI